MELTLERRSNYFINLKKSVEVCREPFVLSLSKHEWLTAHSPSRWLPNPRSPFDKLRANGVLEGPTDFFRINECTVEITGFNLMILIPAPDRR